MNDDIGHYGRCALPERATPTVRWLTVVRDVLACRESSTLRSSQVSFSTAIHLISEASLRSLQ